MEGYRPSCDTDLKLDIGIESFILGPGLADKIRAIQTGRLVGQYSDSSRVSRFLHAQERAKETESKRESRSWRSELP